MNSPAHGGGRREQTAVPRALFAVLVALSLSSAAPVHLARAADINEYTVKAAYISKFGGFIRWPIGAFSSEISPLTICVLGDNPVGAALTRLATRPVGSRPVITRSLKTFVPSDGCHILYAADADANRVRQMLKAAHGAGVLTVTDIAEGGSDSVINFVLRDNRIKFEIDERAASESGLTISSQLLGLAVSVRAREDN